jgi:hypothetical protein
MANTIRTITEAQLSQLGLTHQETNGIPGTQEGEGPIWRMQNGAICFDDVVPFDVAWKAAQEFGGGCTCPKSTDADTLIPPPVGKAGASVAEISGWIGSLRGKCQYVVDRYNHELDVDSCDDRHANEARLNVAREGRRIWITDALNEASTAICTAMRSGKISESEARALWQQFKSTTEASSIDVLDVSWRSGPWVWNKNYAVKSHPSQNMLFQPPHQWMKWVGDNLGLVSFEEMLKLV